MNQSKRSILLLFLSVCTVFIPVKGHAGHVESHEGDLFDLTLSELLKIQIDVVSRFSETPITAAASVSHIAASEWQAFGAVRNSDALSILPGVMIYPNTGDSIAIRGYAQSASGSRRGIATLVDGISVNDLTFGSAQPSMEHVSLGVLDSLDLIRGPGSVQYGTDAFHGVVSFNTYYREKSDNQLRLSTGSDGEARGSWQFSQPFGDGQFFNIALDQFDQHDNEREHWVYGANGRYSPGVSQIKTERDEDTNLGTALLKWHNRRDADLFYQFSILHNETDFSGFPGGGAELGFRTEDTVGNQSRNSLYRLELEQKINSLWRIGNVSYYTDLDRDIDFQTSALIGATHYDVHKHGSQLYAKYVSADQSWRVFTGLEYSYQTIDESFTRSFSNGGAQIAEFPGADEGLSRRVESYLLQARKNFSLLDIEFGVRYDDYSDFGEQTTPRLALIKEFDNQQILKLIYSNAFRAAVSNEKLGNPSVLGDPAIDPETLDSYELVYSRQFHKAFFSATLFKSEWQDGIALTAIATPPGRAYANAADSKSHGAELLYSYEIGKWLFNTDVTYTRSEDEFNAIDYTAFPKYIWNLRATYNFDSTTKLHVTQRLREDMTSGQKNFCSPTVCGQKIDLNTDLDTYWRVDLGVVHKFTPAVSGELVVNNIFDRDNYVPSVYNSPKGIIDDSPSVLATLNLSF